MQDFYQSEFRINPQPDNVVALTKTDPFYTLTAIARFQANEFFETTERLPEVVLDVKRHALFGGPIFYEGETALRICIAILPPTRSSRITAPVGSILFTNHLSKHLFRLALDRAAGRFSRDLLRRDARSRENDVHSRRSIRSSRIFCPIRPDAADFNGDAHFAPFSTPGAKLRSRFPVHGKTCRAARLASTACATSSSRSPISPMSRIAASIPRQFCNSIAFEPSTQLRPIDFPQFTSIDSIDNWTIWRLGVRNRLQTRRDDRPSPGSNSRPISTSISTIPYDRTPYSNLFNKLRFTPVPWASLVIDSQVPAFDKGFTEVNTNRASFSRSRICSSTRPSLPERQSVLPRQQPVQSSAAITGSTTTGASASRSNTKRTPALLEQQRYSVYRDLTSWVASFGAVMREQRRSKRIWRSAHFHVESVSEVRVRLEFRSGRRGR